MQILRAEGPIEKAAKVSLAAFGTIWETVPHFAAEGIIVERQWAAYCLWTVSQSG